MLHSKTTYVLNVILLIIAFSSPTHNSQAAELTKKILNNNSYQLSEQLSDIPLCRKKRPCFVKFNNE